MRNPPDRGPIVFDALLASFASQSGFRIGDQIRHPFRLWASAPITPSSVHRNRAPSGVFASGLCRAQPRSSVSRSGSLFTGFKQSVYHRLRTRRLLLYAEAMTNRRALIGSAGAALAQMFLPQAQAANPVVFQHNLPDVSLKGWSVTAVEVNYPPGGSSTAHRHPGITIV